MRVAIIGSRGYNDFTEFEFILNKFIEKHTNISFVSGGAKGADTLIEEYCKKYNFDIEIFKPDWSLGKHAGFLRNKTIWDNADMGIAFWDGKSKGTKHSFDIAKNQNKTLYVFNYKTKKWTTIQGN